YAKSRRRKAARLCNLRMTNGCGCTTLELRPSPGQRGSDGRAIDEIVQVAAKIAIIIGAEQKSTTVIDDVPVTEMDGGRIAQPSIRENRPPGERYNTQGGLGPPSAPPVRTAHVREADHVRGPASQFCLATLDRRMDLLGAMYVVLMWMIEPGAQ